jgi:hypothetical protein
LGAVPLLYIFRDIDDTDIMFRVVWAIAGMFAIILLIAWVNRGNWGTSVLVDGRTLTLRDYTGRLSSCSIREARFDNTAIATRDAVVIFGRPQAQIYTRADIEERLIPRLGDAQRVSPMTMLTIQIQLRHPQGLVAVLAIIGIIAYAAVTLAS